MELSASGSPRFLKCHASPLRSSFMGPSVSGPEAKEGTFAHNLGEQCIKRNQKCIEYQGRRGYVEGTPFEVSSEMASFVQLYVDEAKRIERLFPNPLIFIERRLRLFSGVSGTADHAVIIPKRIIFINDLKYGRKIIEPDSAQVKFYALGFIGETNPFEAKEVDLGIIQPRASHPEGYVRRKLIPVNELIEWKNDVVNPALKEIRGRNPKATPGPHCEYCQALIICPEILKMIFQLLRITTNRRGIPVEPGIHPKPSILDNESLGELMRIEAVIRNLSAEIYKVALDRFKAGNRLDGFKMVQGRGTKSWKDPKSIEEVLSQMNLADSILTDPELKSPAKILEVLKRSGIDGKTAVKFLSPHINIFHGRKLVPVEDKRPAQNKSAEELFGPAKGS